MAIRYLSGINVDNNVLFVDDTNNRVGVGTGSPVSPLDVNGIISSRGIFVAQNSGTYNVLYNASNSVSIYLGGSADQGNYYDNTTHYFRSPGGGTTYAVINYLGNVGIGTTSPSYKLDVSGDIRSTTINLNTQGVNVSGYGFLSQTLSGQMTFLGHNVRASSTVNNTALVVNGGWISSLIKQYYNEGITFHTSTTEYAAGATYPLADTERMRITSAGNVGIGTTSTFGRLQISGTVVNPDLSSATATGVSLVISNSDTGYGTMFATYGSGNGALQQRRTNTNTYYDFLLQPHGGNVGIGTSSPVVKLQVDGTITSTGVLTAYTSVPSINIGHNGDSAFIAATSGSGANTPISFSVGNNNEKMRITAAGDVGIGTTSPSAKLHVSSTGETTLTVDSTSSGTARINLTGAGGGAGAITSTTNGLYLYASGANAITLNTNGSERLRVSSDGKVGIAVTSLTASLSIGSSSYDSNPLTGIEYAQVTGGGRLDLKVQTWGTGSNYGLTTGLSVVTPGFDTADVRVGIGTTSPSQKLHVVGNTTITGVTYTDVVQTYSGASIDFRHQDASVVMRVDTANARVGIGTTSPAHKLDVSGSIYANGVIISNTYVSAGTNAVPVFSDTFNLGPSNNLSKIQFGNEFFSTHGTYLRLVVNSSTAQNTPVNALTIKPSGLTQLNQYGSGSFTGTVAYNLAVDSSGNVIETAGGVVDGSGTANYVSKWSDANTLTDSQLFDNGTNVGIGTSSPANTLQIGSVGATGYSGNRLAVGDGTNVVALHPGAVSYLTANGDIVIGAGGNTTNQVYVKSGGNVGIGTTSPAGKLHIADDGPNALIIGDTQVSTIGETNNVGYPGMKIVPYNSNIHIGISSTTDNKINLWYGGQNYTYWQQLETYSVISNYSTSALVLQVNGGNVGIGTTSPAYKLQVDGSTGVRNGSFYIGDESGSTNSAVEFYKSGTTIRMYTNTGAFGGTYGATSASLTLYSGSAYSTLINGNGDSYFGTGNLGIGTTSPATKLHVVGYSRNDGGLLLNGSDADYREIIFTTSAASRWNLYAYGGESGSNAGSVLYLARYADNGDYIANVATFLRTNGYVGIATTTPTQQLHVSGNIRVTGAYYDSSNSAGSSGQVLSSTGSGTAWVNQGEATATSLYDLLPAARTTYDWTVQLTAGTWADIFSSNTVLSNGTWMVQAYVSDFAVGGQQYQETYSGVMSWGNASSTNETGPEAISEIILHRSGHAANSGNFYLRTVERASSTLLLQGMSNQTYSAASTINFKFVKIF